MQHRDAMAQRFAVVTRRDEGVTLPELLIVISLLTVVIFTAYLLFDALNGMTDRVEARVRASDEVRLTMDRITREIRQAQEISNGAGAFPAGCMNPRDISFYSDVDHDGAPEVVRYRVVGTALKRTVAQPTNQVPPYTPYLTASQETTVTNLLDATLAASGAIFEYYDRQDPPQPVTGGQVHRVSAVRVHVIGGAVVNRRSAYCDMETWVKVRSVNNAID
jgi:prepilin-type N-terminal cleavage/methylation domain-containing protein